MGLASARAAKPARSSSSTSTTSSRSTIVYGHRLGDEVLTVVASRLRELPRRRGPRCPAWRRRVRHYSFAIARAAMLRRGWRGASSHEIPKPIALAALSLQVGVSVGVAICDRGDTRQSATRHARRRPSETLLRQADMAMYRAKTEGRGRYRFFDRTMDEKLQAARANSKARSRVPSPMARSFRITSRSSTSERKTSRLRGAGAMGAS